MAASMLAFSVTAAPAFTQAADSEYILGSFYSNEDTSINCYLSKDGIHMERWIPMGELTGRDVSCQYYNQKFYVCLVEPEETGNTFKLYRSADLKNWEESEPQKVVERGDKFTAIVAPDLFIDTNGKAYVYFSKQKGYNQKTEERIFDIWVSTISNIEDIFDKGTHFESENTKKMQLPATSENYIDAQVRKINDEYYMVVKNEATITNGDNKSPLLLKSDYPDKDFEEVNNWPLKSIRGYEGFSILEKNGKVYFYAENYTGDYDNAGTSNHTVWVTEKDKIEQGPYKAYYVESEYPMRHGSVIMIDDYAAKNMKIDEFANNRQLAIDNSKKSEKRAETVKLSKDNFENPVAKGSAIAIENFAPASDVQYTVPVKKNVVIKNITNPYGVDKIEVYLTDGGSLKIADLRTFYKEPKSEDEKITFYIDSKGKVLKWMDSDGRKYTIER